jgi:hypothetical protein
MRLYFNALSDLLFWDEFCADPECDDLTDNKDARAAAKARGIKEPEGISEVLETESQLVRTNTWPYAKRVQATGMAKAIVDSYKKWERKPADLYPTPVDGTESLIPVLKAMKRPDGSPIRRIWEPACGDGRLARVLEWHGFEVISTDIREYPGFGYGGLDFLAETPKDKWGWVWPEIDAIVTNPPFNLAEEFIRRALCFTPNVAMLLKQTYWNVGGRSQGLWLDHMPDMELKITWRLAFLAAERGNSPLMDCMWAVWNGDNARLPYRGDGEKKMCVTEPLPRLKYPGYAKLGTLAALKVLEEAMVELTSTLENGDAAWLVNPKES